MGIKVRAKKDGQMVFYGGSRQRPGTEFEIKSMKELNSGMELVKDEPSVTPKDDTPNDPPKEF